MLDLYDKFQDCHIKRGIMEIKIDKNPSRIRNLKALEEAEKTFAKTKQGFFRSKSESDFRKFRDDSKIEDAKLVELHIVKENGKGEYKLNGNLSFNDKTKEIKFYVLSAFEFDNFRFDEKTYVEFINESNSEEEDFKELSNVILKLRNTKPKGSFNNNNNRRDNNRRDGSNSFKKSSFSNNKRDKKY